MVLVDEADGIVKFKMLMYITYNIHNFAFEFSQQLVLDSI